MPKARKKRRKRRTEAEWSEVLRQFEASGLSPRSFCRREGLGLSSLQRWRARLPRASEFVELVPASAPGAPSVSWTIELALPDGTCLRLRA